MKKEINMLIYNSTLHKCICIMFRKDLYQLRIVIISGKRTEIGDGSQKGLY